MSAIDGSGSQKPEPGPLFKLLGADNQPVEIRPGEYYRNTKARARRMAKDSLSSYARQVYAALELGTMGFAREDAVLMTPQGLRHMTPADISKQTGLPKQHVRRAIEELEAEGLAMRQSTEGKAAPLQKGKVRLLSWAIPRAPAGKNGGRTHPPSELPDWFPPTWEPLRSLVTHFKYRLPIELVAARDTIFSEGEELARGYQKAEMVARAFLDKVCAQAKTAGANKEETKERKIERKPPSTSQPVTTTKKRGAQATSAGWPDGTGVNKNNQSEQPLEESASDTTLKAPSLQKQIRTHLESFVIADPLEPATVERVSAAITSDELLAQWKDATAPDRIQPRKWIALVRIAERVASDGPRYQHASAGSAPPPTNSPRPRSRSEEKAAAYARKREQETQ